MNKIKIKDDIIPEIKQMMNLYEGVEWYAYTNGLGIYNKKGILLIYLPKNIQIYGIVIL